MCDSSSLQKIIAVAKRLNLPCVAIVDNEPLVIMSAAVYEKTVKKELTQTASAPDEPLLPFETNDRDQANNQPPAINQPVEDLKGLTEEDLFDRINRDIVAWRSANSQELSQEVSQEPVVQKNEAVEVRTELSAGQEERPAEEEDRFYIEPLE